MASTWASCLVWVRDEPDLAESATHMLAYQFVAAGGGWNHGGRVRKPPKPFPLDVWHIAAHLVCPKSCLM